MTPSAHTCRKRVSAFRHSIFPLGLVFDRPKLQSHNSPGPSDTITEPPHVSQGAKRAHSSGACQGAFLAPVAPIVPTGSARSGAFLAPDQARRSAEGTLLPLPGHRIIAISLPYGGRHYKALNRQRKCPDGPPPVCVIAARRECPVCHKDSLSNRKGPATARRRARPNPSILSM